MIAGLRLLHLLPGGSIRPATSRGHAGKLMPVLVVRSSNLFGGANNSLI